jgi:hypothetical protein
MMNGKQRARWYADLISGGQRLRRQARGAADSVLLDAALVKLGEARALALALALAEVITSPRGDDPEDPSPAGEDD